MRRSTALITGLILAVLAGAASADIVRMKDGREFVGKIVEQSGDVVVVDAMVAGIRATLRLSREDVASVAEQDLPEGFFNPPKPATQQAASGAQSVDADTKAEVDRLRKEVLSLRRELAEYTKQLRATPAKVRKVYHGKIMGPGDSTWRPNSIAVEEPNPQIPILKEKIQNTRDAIGAKNREIARLMNPTRDSERSESELIVARLRTEITAHRRELAELQKKLASTPPKTEWHRVQPGETVGDMFRKREPEPNPEYLAIQKQIKDVQGLIVTKTSQVRDITTGGEAGAAVLDAIRKADAREAAEKTRQADAARRRIAEWVKLYDTPEKAADFCVKDLMARGIIKNAIRTGVGKIEGEKARWALVSGQWATAPHGIGIVAPGAPLPEGGPPRRPGAKGAQVSYTFTFTTQAGLLRENSGYVLVANIDGFWEPWGYTVDGISAPPYDGRAAYEQAQRNAETEPSE